MNDKRTSPSTQSIFVIPIGDEVELYLEYNGLQWSNESINEKNCVVFRKTARVFKYLFGCRKRKTLVIFSERRYGRFHKNIF